MTDRKPTHLAASVRQRLLNRARAEGRPFQELATHFAMERFLFRLGRSSHAGSFVLKGGLMTLTWAGERARVTRDIDLLGWGVNSVEAVTERLRDVLLVEVVDGVVFDVTSLAGSAIALEARYVGVRVTFAADLGGMRMKMQVDVGFGDAVVTAPDPIVAKAPSLRASGLAPARHPSTRRTRRVRHTRPNTSPKRSFLRFANGSTTPSCSISGRPAFSDIQPKRRSLRSCTPSSISSS